MRIILWTVLLLVLFQWLFGVFNAGNEISYSEFRARVAAGEVAEVTVKDDTIRGVMAAAEAGEEGEADGESVPPPETFVTYLPAFGDDELLGLLEANGVEVVTRPGGGSVLPLLIFGLLPVVVLVGLGWLMLRRMGAQGGQMLSIGKSKAKLYERSEEATTFDDVAGADGAKGELREIIEFLKNPERTRRLGGKPPRGVLLVGPPGTGKTLLARATAGEAEVPFFSITGSDFMEMFVGVGASRVRSLFRDARKTGPSIVFIDELDSIGRRRGAGLGGGHDEREQTLNQLLSEMDGFEPNDDVILIAATNRPDILDPALLRPGRFDRRITVEAPGKDARRKILEVHARNKPLASDVDLDELARSTPGFSGADLENLLNEGAILAARHDKRKIHKVDLDEARDKILLGLEREGVALTESDCRLLAYHEAGHAVVAAVVPHGDPIHKVSIVPRGRAMGVTQQLPERDQYVYSLGFLRDRLAVMMGGRAAEELVLDTATSGAENDLKEAVRLARTMVLDWGMGANLNHLALGDTRRNVFLGEEIAQGRDYSEATGREVDRAIRRLAGEAFERATEILKEHREGLDRLAEALLEHEELGGDEALELIGLAR
ncbi:MAG TPA: ATP-dependent zinc metalloprotease FtsH [Candidatus Sulfomarinibacteraceae bacterium]|nr:ATP-dependent zinc metalloprotease FtsH [Candidatus Sulfomarinibacteraceae bacterium]